MSFHVRSMFAVTLILAMSPSLSAAVRHASTPAPTDVVASRASKLPDRQPAPTNAPPVRTPKAFDFKSLSDDILQDLRRGNLTNALARYFQSQQQGRNFNLRQYTDDYVFNGTGTGIAAGRLEHQYRDGYTFTYNHDGLRRYFVHSPPQFQTARVGDFVVFLAKSAEIGRVKTNDGKNLNVGRAFKLTMDYTHAHAKLFEGYPLQP
ncbi:MAG: hypothetical protein H7338_06095 [Candidatus Sericytochromatia bacterium]|nr:hypothetical protein [Candidatus Sericytochromatia bacterium]